MKISKLFHWLYAIVLLLPVFSIGGKMLYVTFNPNAKDSYSGSEVTKSLVTNYASIENGKQYNLKFNIDNSISCTSYIYYYDEIDIDMSRDLPSQYIYLGIQLFNVSGSYYLRGFTDIGVYQQVQLSNLNYYSNINFTLDNCVQNGGSLTNQLLYEYSFTQLNLDNVFYYAVGQINEQPIFAWAKDSFLVEPIAYVSELFGLSNTSPLITLLSYWLNMSIIWLCFDIIMYVPLMAHRWLDKGAIE